MLVSLVVRLKRAHPRVSGENQLVIYPLRACEGSSPRERGKPHNEGVSVSRAGLIPA